MKGYRNDNMVKLRELTEKLSKESNNDEYVDVVKKLKNIVDTSKEEADTYENNQAKVKCYEKMYASLAALFTTLNF